MPKIDISFAELHSPLFLDGIGWGVKLFNKQAKGELGLVYDQEHQELHVTHKKNDTLAIIPTPSVASMTPRAKEKELRMAPAMANQHRTDKPNIKGAQVSTPQDHVFAGVGGGDTGVGKRTK